MLTSLTKRNIDPSLALGVVVLFLTTLLIWLPFGFQLVGTAEEWRWMSDFDDSLVFADSYNRLRPLQISPLLVAYLIQPDSFYAANIIMFLAFFLKGLGLLLILRYVFPKHKGLVLFAALLFAVFPADEGLFVLRDMMHHVAVALLTLSGFFALDYTKRGKLYLAAFYMTCTVISLFIYEAGYPVALLIAFLPFVTHGSAQWKWKSLVVGLGTIVLCAVFVGVVYLSRPSNEEALYQAAIVQDNITSPRVMASMITSIMRMYVEHFALGWIEAFKSLWIRPYLTLLAFSMSLGAGLALWRVSGNDSFQWHTNMRMPWVCIIIICLVFMLAGYILFVPSRIRHDDWRVYLYSSAAAALAVATFIHIVTRKVKKRRFAYSVIGMVLLFLSFTKALNQQAHFQENSDFIKETLVQLVEQVPALELPASLVFLDNPPIRDLHIDMFYHHQSVREALRYIYNDPLEKDVMRSDFCIDDETYRSKSCVFEEDGVHVYFPKEVVIQYEKLLLFRYNESVGYLLQEQLPAGTPDSAQVLYRPHDLINDSASLPSRIKTL